MKVYCYSRFDFAKEMQRLGWNDETLPKNVAIISICCTEPVKQHWKSQGYEGNEDEHYFGDAENVFNVDFDDISEATRDCGDFTATCITREQACAMVRFIIKHSSCDFYIHCNAGKSRSQAVVRYITDFLGQNREIETRHENPCLYPNAYVLSELRRATADEIYKSNHYGE